MPDTRAHRGPAPGDEKRFAPPVLEVLRTATAELSWLLARGYADASALALVGNRHQLDARQRTAIARSAAPDAIAGARRERRLALAALRERDLGVDGFNVLIVGESALSGGVVLRGRDGAHRDLASVHGTWRRVEETARVLDELTDRVALAAPRSVVWYLDRPVGNSGRLAAMLRERFDARSLGTWRVEVVPSPDRALAEHEGVVATGDGWILDRASAWVDLPAELPTSWLVDLG